MEGVSMEGVTTERGPRERHGRPREPYGRPEDASWDARFPLQIAFDSGRFRARTARTHFRYRIKCNPTPRSRGDAKSQSERLLAGQPDVQIWTDSQAAWPEERLGRRIAISFLLLS